MTEMETKKVEHEYVFWLNVVEINVLWDYIWVRVESTIPYEVVKNPEPMFPISFKFCIVVELGLAKTYMNEEKLHIGAISCTGIQKFEILDKSFFSNNSEQTNPLSDFGENLLYKNASSDYVGKIIKNCTNLPHFLRFPLESTGKVCIFGLKIFFFIQKTKTFPAEYYTYGQFLIIFSPIKDH